MADIRFCPLHGDYEPQGTSTACPSCKDDPLVSSASLQRVKVVTDRGPDPEGRKSPVTTPVGEDSACPVCGAITAFDDFRFERMGEEWTGKAAEWAEEGVCPGCHKDLVPRYVRKWSDAEWLAHHYEGWRTTLEQAAELFVYDESAEDSWLPEGQRHKVLDIEKTLSARREHLGRCQAVMDDLMTRYPVGLTPPPFQSRLAKARDRALSDTVIAKLKGIRERHLFAQEEKRNESIIGYTPASGEQGPSADKPEGGSAPGAPSRRSALFGLPLAVLVLAGLVAAMVVSWWLLD